MINGSYKSKKSVVRRDVEDSEDCPDLCAILDDCDDVRSRVDFQTLSVNLLYEIAQGIAFLVAAAGGPPVTAEAIEVPGFLAAGDITTTFQTFLDPQGALVSYTIHNELNYPVELRFGGDNSTIFYLPSFQGEGRELKSNGVVISSIIEIRYLTAEDVGNPYSGNISILGLKAT